MDIPSGRRPSGLTGPAIRSYHNRAMTRHEGGVAFPLLLLMVFFGLCGIGCKSATVPDQARELYDFTITYRRTAIAKPENRDPTELVVVVQGEKFPFPLIKVSDDTFTSEAKGLPTNVDADDLQHAVYVIDPKRFDAEYIMGPYDYGRPHSVGDIVILKCEQTGEEKQLTDIVPNVYLWDLPAKCFPRMARFRILKGGAIK